MRPATAVSVRKGSAHFHQPARLQPVCVVELPENGNSHPPRLMPRHDDLQFSARTTGREMHVIAAQLRDRFVKVRANIPRYRRHSPSPTDSPFGLLITSQGERAVKSDFGTRQGSAAA